ncbi:hypothetical protein ACIO6U_03010 [Streptomyces sp. NPDC087422]|uniref:hypothetical protein n=1 Tax=Streptomyces sp. NPDC087422 TaxID=3365786 RepID=UPI00381A16E0
MIWLVLLALVAALVVSAVFSAHIPILRDLVDAAPLEADEPDPLPLLAADTQADHVAAALARDFANTDAAGYIERAEWPAGTPTITDLPLPTPHKEAS